MRSVVCGSLSQGLSGELEEAVLRLSSIYIISESPESAQLMRDLLRVILANPSIIGARNTIERLEDIKMRVDNQEDVNSNNRISEKYYKKG